MRVALLTTAMPFVTGGAEAHVAEFAKHLQRAGHDVDILRIPLNDARPETLLRSIQSAQCCDLDGVLSGADLVVGMKFPAYLIRHPRKVYWLIHQYRGAYDLWHRGASPLFNHANGAAVREIVKHADRQALGAPGTRVFANSQTVRNRLRFFLNIESEVLYHPPPDAERFYCAQYGDYLYAPSRISTDKRHLLLIRALAQTECPLRLVISGAADRPQRIDELRHAAEHFGVEDRVDLLGHVSARRKRELYANARAVAFVPRDEDLGYVTLEAMLSHKAVLTTDDAGGPLEFIKDLTTGYVVEPSVEAIAAAMERFWQDPAEAARLGEAGAARYKALNIAWTSVIARLLMLGKTQGRL